MVKNEAIEEFVQAIQQPQLQPGTTYNAIVARIDDEGVAWVNLAGSDKETPTASVSAEVEKGDAVTVEWRNNKLYIAGNYSNPSAGMVRVQSVENVSTLARSVAETANLEADNARIVAENARNAVAEIEDDISDLSTRVATAEGDVTALEGDISALGGRVSTVEGNVTTLEGKVSTAEGNITRLEGRISTAEDDISAVEGNITSLQGRVATAEDDIDETLNGLAIAQDVIGTINWITEHGAMTLTSDTQVNPNKVYFEVDPNGIYVVGTTHYSIVESPTTSGLSSYYELSVDEAVTNYVSSHLALTNEGLYVAKDNSHWKVLVGDDGVYIIDGSSGINKIVASYSSSVVIGQNAAQMSRTVINTNGMSVYRKTSNGTDVEIANLGYGVGNTEEGGTAYAPYYTLGERKSGSDIGNYSMAEGYRTTASNSGTHAEGNRTVASGAYSHAEGSETTASGYAAHAEGYNTTANTQSAHAEGQYTIASGYGAHAEGFSNPDTYTITASGNGAHAEGYAVYGNILASSYGAHAEGGATTASGNYSHAEGDHTTASGTRSHAEGGATTASGDNSHAEGNNTTASDHSAHAEGRQTTASGAYSHSEGLYTVAEGDYSHAEGNSTTASGDASHAQNYHTTAGYSYQTAIGIYNDNTEGNLFEIGNGTSSLASNAFSVDLSGNVVCAGTVTDSSGRTLLSAETDPTVPSWAKASTKPSYSASEISGLIDMFYPVGSYYETSDTTFNPNTAWGGTWSLETEGQVHISAGSNYSVSGALTDTTDGGEATHTLAKTEIPEFEGQVYVRGYKTSSTASRAAIAHGGTGIISVGAVGTNTANGILAAGGIADLGSNPLTVSFGGGQAHNNMQPYIVVNRWHRTA